MKKYYHIIFELKFDLNKNFEDILNVKCKYKLLEFNKNEQYLEFQDENILNTQFKDNFGFIFLINAIFDIESENENSSDNEYSEYYIIEFIKIIGNHEKTAEFIIELNNGFYISGSINHKLNIYDQSFKIIQTIELKSLKSTNISDRICEINSDENNIQLFVCSKTDLFVIKINLNPISIQKFNKQLDNMYYCNQFIKIKKENYIMVGSNGAFHLSGLSGQIIEIPKNKNVKYFPLFENKIYLSGGIKINENLVVFTSNSIYNHGKDKLFLYNLNEKKIAYEIKDFSFNTSTNGLCLMNLNDIFPLDKALLCACKKYLSNQKKGILLVDPQLKDNEEVYFKFYETEFEINCFCQIYIIKDEAIGNIIDKRISVKQTNYFLVGRFNEGKRIGVINLYKLIYNVKTSLIEIEFITEIGFSNLNKNNSDDFDKFNELNSIKCIIQSKRTGNILICSSDGNIYSFKFIDEEIS